MSDEITEGMLQSEDGTILRFFYDPVKNEKATEYAGRPIYDNCLMVDVITPGQTTGTPRFEVERVWAEQSREAIPAIASATRQSSKYEDYRKYVEAFKANENVGDLQGTPLKQWPRIDRALAATLAGVNVHTVEALASIADQNINVLGMGGYALRESARQFIQQGDVAAQSRTAAEVAFLKTENERLSQSLRELNDRMTAMAAELNQAKAQPPTPTPEPVFKDDPLSMPNVVMPSAEPPPVETTSPKRRTAKADPLA